MCRLLGYVAAKPTSVVSLLGPEAFETFTELSAVHGDGWGMAWDVHGEILTQSAPNAAVSDVTYRDLASIALSDAGLVHLRWATDGHRVEPTNTHPFTAGGLALAHNGAIRPVDRLHDMLSDRAREALRGSTDSEQYLQYVLDRIEAVGDEAAGIRDAVERLGRTFTTSSLNAIILSPEALYAVHVNSGAEPPVGDLRQMFGSDERMPIGHATAYYSLAYRVDDHGFEVISTGIDPMGWTPVPHDSMLRVDLATRAVEITELDLVPVAARR